MTKVIVRLGESVKVKAGTSTFVVECVGRMNSVDQYRITKTMGAIGPGIPTGWTNTVDAFSIQVGEKICFPGFESPVVDEIKPVEKQELKRA